MLFSGLVAAGSLSVMNAMQHKRDLLCDVALTDAHAAASFYATLARHFAAAAFVHAYLALLCTSLPTPFRDLTHVSLAERIARPSVRPTNLPPSVVVAGLLLELRGISI